MSGSHRGLASVARVFATRERTLREELIALEQQLQSATQKLGELERYRSEESGRLHTGSGTDPHRLLNQQQFLVRLNEAIGQQGRIVAVISRDHLELGQRWLELRKRHAALEKLLDKREAAVRAALEKRLQKELDDAVCLAYGRDSAIHG